ncbi:unnamed protein product, partial [Amoebophrya sp. A25]
SNDDLALPGDLERLIALSSGEDVGRLRQRWVPYSFPARASDAQTNSKRSVSPSFGGSAQHRGHSVGDERPGRRLGPKKFTNMDIHCMNLYLKKKMNQLRHEVMRQEEVNAQALLQAEQNMVVRVEEEARRIQFELQR